MLTITYEGAFTTVSRTEVRDPKKTGNQQQYRYKLSFAQEIENVAFGEHTLEFLVIGDFEDQCLLEGFKELYNQEIGRIKYLEQCYSQEAK